MASRDSLPCLHTCRNKFSFIFTVIPNSYPSYVVTDSVNINRLTMCHESLGRGPRDGVSLCPFDSLSNSSSEPFVRCQEGFFTFFELSAFYCPGPMSNPRMEFPVSHLHLMDFGSFKLISRVSEEADCFQCQETARA